MKFRWILLTAALIGANCSSTGYSRTSLANNKPTDILIDDAEIKKYTDLKPQVSLPFKIGVYVVENENSLFRIDGNEKNELLAIEADLKKRGIVSQMYLIKKNISNPLEEKEVSGYQNRYQQRTDTLNSIKAVRILAAKYGADAVLIVNPEVTVKRTCNGFCSLYLTIAGIWLAPGSEREVIFNVNASLWDVKNEYLYLTAESEAVKTKTRPYGILDEEALIKEAKTEAFTSFVKELGKRTQSLK
jgi:hypothetical protein